MTQTLEHILKSSKYSLSIFSTEIINKIERSIIQKDDLQFIADAFEEYAKEQKLSFWR